MSKLVEPLDLFVTIVSTSKLECTYSLIWTAFKKTYDTQIGNFFYFPDLE